MFFADPKKLVSAIFERKPEKIIETAATIAVRDVIISPSNHELIYQIVSMILSGLQAQAKEKWKSLPTELIALLKPHYKADLTKVRYAENIKTPDSKSAIAFPNEIFFPTTFDPLHNKGDLHWLLHELKHIEQYERVGGLRPYLRDYSADIVVKVFSKQTFDVHDHLAYEKEAEQHADNLCDQIWHDLTRTNRLTP